MNKLDIEFDQKTAHKEKALKDMEKFYDKVLKISPNSYKRTSI